MSDLSSTSESEFESSEAHALEPKDFWHRVFVAIDMMLLFGVCLHGPSSRPPIRYNGTRWSQYGGLCALNRLYHSANHGYIALISDAYLSAASYGYVS